MSREELNNEDYNIEEKENNPIIISNELDQAPKTWEHYQKRLNSMHDELIKILICNLTFEEWEDPEETEKIVSWLQSNQDSIPLYKISKELLEHKWRKISLLLTKEKVKWEWFITMIWSPLPIEHVIYDNLWSTWTKEWDMIERWEIWTFISFEDTDSWQIKLSLHQLEVPGWLIMDWLWCHKKITFDEFEKALSNAAPKETEDSEENKWWEVSSKKSFRSKAKKFFS